MFFFKNLCMRDFRPKGKQIASLLLFLLFSLSFFSCEGETLPIHDLEIKKANGDTLLLKAEIAIKEEDQMKGLMFRKSVPDGTAMLFVFDKDKIARFWMKDTP
ncbi:MAG TPA: hypothetical protein DDW88_05900, partial [Treponema sp.]|nr:hypothetical protein [Treponema sp.]